LTSFYGGIPTLLILLARFFEEGAEEAQSFPFSVRPISATEEKGKTHYESDKGPI
jgi:hypothetical protein